MLRKRLQLGLIHLAVAMTLVPINSTLNRVMIKEMAISATLVALLASLPYLFSPIQVAIGAYSDRHPVFGWRRTPYIFLGLLLCSLGVIVSPWAAFELDRSWAAIPLAALAFSAWGMGFNLSTVSYLSLASELSGEKDRGKTVAVMWFMMIVGIIATAILLGRLVDPYTPQALQSAFLTVGLLALALGLIGLFGLEPRGRAALPAEERYTWRLLLGGIRESKQVSLFFVYLVILLAALLGQDVLLEPYGGEAFHLPVNATTRITAIWGTCFLITLVIAGLLENRISQRRQAELGGWGAMLGLALIALGGPLLSQGIFYSGVVLLGLGSGLSTVANLSLMLKMTTASKVGMFIGAWGMANAVSRLIGSLLAGGVRDILTRLLENPILGYAVVFGIEALLLLVSLYLLGRIDVEAFQQQVESPSVIERAAIAAD